MSRLGDDVIQDIVQEGRIYEVGGSVRDTFLGREVDPKDSDYLVCGVPYDRLREILSRYGYVDLVGKSFGVLKFSPRGTDRSVVPAFDIVLPRKEVSTGAGHRDFTVEFDPALKVEDDLARRDFTINAIARDLQTGDVIDPFEGRKDIENGVIRMVTAQSFREDPLRMLRAVQFAARFSFAIEPETKSAITENASLIKTVSPERIAEELNKMLVRAEKPSTGFILMQETGLLREILPELEETVGVDQPGGYHAYDVFMHTMHMLDAAPKRLLVRLATIFHDITKPRHKRVTDTGATFYGHENSGAEVARHVLHRLRYSNDIIRDVSILVERHMFTTDVGPKGLRRFIRRVGLRLIPDLLDLRRADVIAQGKGGTTEDVDELQARVDEEVSRKSPFTRSELALSGNDIMKIFELQESPVIGEVIEHLMEMVLDNPEDNTREKLIEYARAFLEDNKQI
jgi:putative nucleotidyltransferase with HDIG domain